MKTNTEQKPVTLIEQCREVESILGGTCKIFISPNFAVIRGSDTFAITLDGPAAGCWRKRNQKKIETLRQKVKQLEALPPEEIEARASADHENLATASI